MKEDSTKNKVARTLTDPWACLLGRRPESYQIPEVGERLIESIDYALFERDTEAALELGVVLDKWARHDETATCKANAVWGSIFSVSGQLRLAEKRLWKAESKLADSPCRRLEYYRRNGVLLDYRSEVKEALTSFDLAYRLSLELDDIANAAKSVIARGVMRYKIKEYDIALSDHELGLKLADFDYDNYIAIQAFVNVASILTAMGKVEEAKRRIQDVEKMIVGRSGLVRVRLVLRWLRALLLELLGKYEAAGQILDRLEVRFANLDLRGDLSVLYADRARVSRSVGTTKKFAKKALEIEDFPHRRKLIKSVLKEPTQEMIKVWRQNLDSYVPTFPTAA